MDNQQKPISPNPYSDELFPDEKFNDEIMERYIEKQRFEFYEEWFQYLDRFYQ